MLEPISIVPEKVGPEEKRLQGYGDNRRPADCRGGCTLRSVVAIIFRPGLLSRPMPEFRLPLALTVRDVHNRMPHEPE